MTTAGGIDGCKGGWVLASRDAQGDVSFAVHRSFAGLAASMPDDAILAVDMPIGLPDRTGNGGRGAEQAVRPYLKARRTSVFSVPSRAAIHAEPGPFENESARLAAHKRASLIALATSDPPRKISIQAFGLFAKIRELDVWLREDKARSNRVIESHPEFAFTILNSGEPMALPKKIKGKVNSAGMAERRALLCAMGFDAASLNQQAPRGANSDDVLDACVLLLVAERKLRGLAKAHPDNFGRDAFGLPIAIWA